MRSAIIRLALKSLAFRHEDEKAKTFSFDKYLTRRDVRRAEVKNTDSENYENKNLAHNAHSVGVSECHLQWCTKYRYDTLAKESHYRDCENAVRTVAKKHGMEITEIGIMSDHIHVVVYLPPDMSPSKAIGLLKGGGSYILFRSHPNFRKTYWGGHFWSRGYFYRSASNVDEDKVSRYVREDNNPWQRQLT